MEFIKIGLKHTPKDTYYSFLCIKLLIYAGGTKPIKGTKRENKGDF